MRQKVLNDILMEKGALLTGRIIHRTELYAKIFRKYKCYRIHHELS